MSNLIKGKATICIVNYKTLDFTRLCLRSIRKFTKYPYEVIVVDNDSQDESLKYLKSLNWIRLIERRAGANEPGGGYAHSAGLDLGLENCNTEFETTYAPDRPEIIYCEKFNREVYQGICEFCDHISIRKDERKCEFRKIPSVKEK